MFKHTLKMVTVLVVCMSSLAPANAALVSTHRYKVGTAVHDESGYSGGATVFCERGEIASGGGHSIMSRVNNLQIEFNGPIYRDGLQGWQILFVFDGYQSNMPGPVVHVICLKP